MLGGGHVRRLSLVFLMDASPCVCIEKRKQCAVQEAKAFKNVERHESPNKARVVEKPSIASSFQFGGKRMIKAQRGLLERQSLEDSCFVADGEDMSGCEYQ
jgi:serine/arginine repetitive matrix protein 2